MSDQDQNPIETAESQNSGGTAGNGDPKQTPPEGFVPKEQFVASQTEAIRLKKELDALKTPAQNNNLSGDKQVLFSAIEEYEKKKVEESKKADEELKANLDKLHSIHGDFDDKKLLSVVDEYGVYNDEGKIKWEKAVELYKKLGNSVVRKPDVGARTQDSPLEAEKVNVKGKHMHELVQDQLRKFGIGGNN